MVTKRTIAADSVPRAVALTRDEVKGAPEFKEGSSLVVLGPSGAAAPAPVPAPDQAANPAPKPEAQDKLQPQEK